MLHENLADPRHKTNVHLHHRLPYHTTRPSADVRVASSRAPSFFNISPTSTEQFVPIGNEVGHKPFTVSQFLTKKLRWVTLGGQYDWAAKRYSGDEPPFPKDVAQLIRGWFPLVKPEAAIVNLYREGDVLGMHRDVSEDCDKPLVSISLGCDGLFVVCLPDESSDRPHVIMRLHSGDTLYMSGRARFAWHGVPRIFRDTCPSWLGDWPAERRDDFDACSEYEAWRGWISSRRVNLNVRQIRG